MVSRTWSSQILSYNVRGLDITLSRAHAGANSRGIGRYLCPMGRGWKGNCPAGSAGSCPSRPGTQPARTECVNEEERRTSRLRLSKTSERPKVARRQIIRRTSNEKEQRMADQRAKTGRAARRRACIPRRRGRPFSDRRAEAGRRFALVEHPIPPRALAAPMHRHRREDEYSFVLEGSIGAMLGEQPSPEIRVI